MELEISSYPECIELAKEVINNPDKAKSITSKRMAPKIRFSLLTSCESGCDFCHLEGEKTTNEIGTLNEALSGWKMKSSLPIMQRLGAAVTTEDVDSVISTAKKLGANAIHLTGGEPTLHPHISDFIGRIKASGLKTVITTHGEIGQRHMAEVVAAGVDSVNFSVHALEPAEYVEMDLVAQEKNAKQGRDAALAYARARLQSKKDNIEGAARAYVKIGAPIVKINSVVREASQSIRILLWAQELGVDCRFQKNLNEKGISDSVLTDIIASLGARLSSVISSNGDSTRSGLVFSYPENDDHAAGKFIIKEERIRDVYLPELCDDCELKDTDQCRERFYGVRAGKAGGTLCMDSRDADSHINLHNPDTNRLLEAVKKHYENARIDEIAIL